MALSAVFFGGTPPAWVRGAGAGAGAAVAAVAVRAGADLARPSFERTSSRPRWVAYVVLGAAAGALLGAYLVLVLLACGLWSSWPFTVRLTDPGRPTVGRRSSARSRAASVGGLGAVAWVAFKVGALSYGGGFVIVPLMQGDAVHTYHWMTSAQFLDAVALGQVTPGPVVATVAAVGYAAHGVSGAALAAAVAFAPSFAFVLLGGGQFQRVRIERPRAGIPGRRRARRHRRDPGRFASRSRRPCVRRGRFAVLAAAAVALLIARRGIVITLLAAGVDRRDGRTGRRAGATMSCCAGTSRGMAHGRVRKPLRRASGDLDERT